MDKSTLLIELGKLAEAFSVSDKRVEKLSEIYHEILRDKISDVQMARAAEHLLFNGDKFPTIKVLLEVARTFPDPKFEVVKTNCITCQGMGTVYAEISDRGHTYKTLFKCPDCENCGHDYPKWDNDFRRRGYRLIDTNVYWDADDENIIKGLVVLCFEKRGDKLVLRKDSTLWKKTPEDCQQAALKLAQEWRPKTYTVGEALMIKADRVREFRREKNVEQDNLREDLSF